MCYVPKITQMEAIELEFEARFPGSSFYALCYIYYDSSQPGVDFVPRETFLVFKIIMCYWHLVGKGQRCC